MIKVGESVQFLNLLYDHKDYEDHKIIKIIKISKIILKKMGQK